MSKSKLIDGIVIGDAGGSLIATIGDELHRASTITGDGPSNDTKERSA